MCGCGGWAEQDMMHTVNTAASASILTRVQRSDLAPPLKCSKFCHCSGPRDPQSATDLRLAMWFPTRIAALTLVATVALAYLLVTLTLNTSLHQYREDGLAAAVMIKARDADSAGSMKGFVLLNIMLYFT